MKKLFLLIPLFLLAFTSQYTPHLNNFLQPLKCDKELHKTAFDICYSYKWKTPKVVAYKVYGNLIDKYNYPRKYCRFKSDNNIPKKYRAYPKDLSHTGLDKGHLAHNAIFDYDRKVQKETFLMSNVAPQAPKLNRILWRKIERFEEIEAKKYKQIEVVTGVCGSKGNLGRKRHNVNIPAYWYKIIYVPVTNNYIAFLAPNTNAGMKKARLKEYRTTLEDIKKICKF
jgi:endonuclease G